MYRNIIEEVGKSIEKEIEITDTRIKGLKKLIYDLYMSLFPRDKAKAYYHILYGFSMLDNLLYQGRCSGKTSISMYLLENRFKAKSLLNMMLDK
jgi:hypothetical protein